MSNNSLVSNTPNVKMKFTEVTPSSAVINGEYVHWTQMTPAQEDAWREELALQLPTPTKTRKPRRTATRRAGSSSRKQNHAAAVVGRATLELVTRVNEDNSAAARYGLEAVA